MRKVEGSSRRPHIGRRRVVSSSGFAHVNRVGEMQRTSQYKRASALNVGPSQAEQMKRERERRADPAEETLMRKHRMLGFLHVRDCRRVQKVSNTDLHTETLTELRFATDSIQVPLSPRAALISARKSQSGVPRLYSADSLLLVILELVLKLIDLVLDLLLDLLDLLLDLLNLLLRRLHRLLARCTSERGVVSLFPHFFGSQRRIPCHRESSVERFSADSEDGGEEDDSGAAADDDDEVPVAKGSSPIVDHQAGLVAVRETISKQSESTERGRTHPHPVVEVPIATRSQVKRVEGTEEEWKEECRGR